LTIHEPHRLSELEEVLGNLRSIEITEIGLIAVIGKVSVLLPDADELVGKLQGLIGRRVDLLRLEGYHLLCIDSGGIPDQGSIPSPGGELES
jgi:hypothetical protein